MSATLALEEELSQIEKHCGALQAEIMKSNGIMERVQVRIHQKQQEFLLASNQLNNSRQCLNQAEKLAKTAQLLVNQATQNGNQIHPNVLERLHLLDKAHDQVLDLMKGWTSDTPGEDAPPRSAPSGSAPSGSVSGLQSQSNSRNSPRQQQAQMQPNAPQLISSPRSSFNTSTSGRPRLVTQESQGGNEDNYEYFGLSSS